MQANDGSQDNLLEVSRGKPSVLLPTLAKEEKSSSHVHAGRNHDTTWCLLMHVGLIVVHIVLLIVALKKWERNVSEPLGTSSSRLQTGLTVGSSVFGTVRLLCLPDDTSDRPVSCTPRLYLRTPSDWRFGVMCTNPNHLPPCTTERRPGLDSVRR
jgi:hypothetical protein